MLVLTRKPGEVLLIGEDIRVTVLSVRGNLVRVGIDAPRSVPVHRQEVYARIQREKSQAGETEAPGGDAPEGAPAAEVS
ncbi:MAG: carbon storage regulator CsrA [Steroidobacteraceae bacterium]